VGSSEIVRNRERPICDRGVEPLVVEARLVGVGLTERDDGPIELLSVTQVGSDRDGVARTRVTACKDGAADLAVEVETGTVEAVDVDGSLPVAQLPDVEVAAMRAGRPAEEAVALRLDAPLPFDDALAVVPVLRLAEWGSSTDGLASFACRNRGSSRSRPSSNRT
jgi:hypothetical protein